MEVSHETNGVTDYDVTTNYDVAAAGTSANCVDSVPEVCTLQIPAPIAENPDFDTFVFTLYDQAPGGTPLTFGENAHVLGAGTTTGSIAANVGNQISVYIDGMPTSLEFGQGTTQQVVVSGDGYLGFTATLEVEPLDADFNVVSGGVYDPFDAFAVGVTEPVAPAGSTTLSLALAPFSGAAPPACNAAAANVAQVTTCRTSDVVTASYLQPLTSTFTTSYYATIASATASVATIPADVLYVSPIFISAVKKTTAATFTPGNSGSSPQFELDGDTGTVLLSEIGATTQGSGAEFSVSNESNCDGVIASGGIAPAAAANSFAITGAPVGTAPSGTNCTVTFEDSYGGTVALIVTNNGASESSVGRRAVERGNHAAPVGR